MRQDVAWTKNVAESRAIGALKMTRDRVVSRVMVVCAKDQNTFG